MKIPLLLREIEARTEDAADKETVLKILDMEEASISKIIKQIRGPVALTLAFHLQLCLQENWTTK